MTSARQASLLRRFDVQLATSRQELRALCRNAGACGFRLDARQL